MLDKKQWCKLQPTLSDLEVHNSQVLNQNTAKDTYFMFNITGKVI